MLNASALSRIFDDLRLSALGAHPLPSQLDVERLPMFLYRDYLGEALSSVGDRISCYGQSGFGNPKFLALPLGE